MSESKHFHIGDVLTVATGVLLVEPRDMGRIYEILDHMTGERLYTPGLARAIRSCGPWLLRQHPQLADVDASSVNESNWRPWLAEQAARLGETLPVAPCPPSADGPRDPVREFVDMIGPGRVVVVGAPGDPAP